MTVLGTEAARPHEINAIAFGSGDAAALALALMPHVNAPASAPAFRSFRLYRFRQSEAVISAID